MSTEVHVHGTSSPLMTEATSTTPPKYSRYRSVRRAAVPAHDVPTAVEERKDDFAPTRSMSRYRRARVGPKADHSASNKPPIPTMPQVPRALHSQSVNAGSRSREPMGDAPRRVTDPVHDGLEHTKRRQGETERPQRTLQEALSQDFSQDSTTHRAISEGQSIKDAEEAARRILAEQKRKDLERLEAELEAAAPAQSTSSSREKLKFFSRKRDQAKTTSPSSKGAGAGAAGTKSDLARVRSKSNELANGNGPPRSLEHPPSARTDSVSKGSRVDESPKRVGRAVEAPKAIEQGGGGIVPQTDAPISASNAGERRVLIRCKQSSINLPIHPNTTPKELIYSAANIMNQNISTSSALLLESYTQLGLERRIRRYEHVRDIMNSWDRDTQNALLLENSDSPKYDKDLEASSVPKEAPADCTVYLYHSQKPGKWNKRYITIQSNGQIFISRKSGTKSTDKDAANICHLSDFDVYTPTAQQMRKNLKPPKKHCCAIKSQQKTTMFLSTENFVHFFCTDDHTLYEKWYDAVQLWRSWYLVNRMGEGRRVAGGKSVKTLTTDALDRSGTRADHSVKVSVDESPYTIGSFQPLLDTERFGSPSQNHDEDSDEENRPRQVPFHLRHSVALQSIHESKRHPPPVNYKLPLEAEEEFAATGLLGRTYTQRQRMQTEKAHGTEAFSGPFVDGPSLLNRSGHQRSLSVKSKRPETSAGSGGLQRGNSQKQKTKPLLDFTPTFKEPPQWDKTGKGHGVKVVEGVPLVEVATGPVEATGNGIPQTVFRRDQRPTTAGAGKESDGAFIKGGLVDGT